MNNKIIIEKKAKKELLHIPKEWIPPLVEAIDALSHNPRPPACKKLTGKDGYRLRRAKHRILYTIDETKHQIIIYRVSHRREVYREY